MNIIDCWKAAKEGQKIHRPSWKFEVTKSGLLSNVIDESITLEQNLLADDWEIVKTPHKIELSWGEFSYGAFSGKDIPNVAKVVITWED